MASLLAFKELLEELISQKQKAFWKIRLGVAIVGSLLAVICSGFVRYHALRLDAVHPFFESFDITVGILMVAGVLLLNFLHWGWLLTSLIIIIVSYFFFGYLVPYPILRLPQYEVGFVIHYLGLGLSEGMFWLARLAADKLYFLVIFAAILLGVGMLKMVIEVGKVTVKEFREGLLFRPSSVVNCCLSYGQAVSNVVLTEDLRFQ